MKLTKLLSGAVTVFLEPRGRLALKEGPKMKGSEGFTPPVKDQPAEFSVGVYRVSAAAAPTRVPAGRPLRFTLRVTAAARPPEPPRRPRLENDPEIARDFFVETPDPDRKKFDELTWEFYYLLKPKTTRVKEVPEVPFSFTDPAAGQETGAYQKEWTQAIPLAVTPAPQGPAVVEGGAEPPAVPDSALGIDYLKHDWCSYGNIARNDASPELEKQQKPYIRMRQALDKVNRDILYSLCQYGMANVWEWGASPLVKANCWRTTGEEGPGTSAEGHSLQTAGLAPGVLKPPLDQGKGGRGRHPVLPLPTLVGPHAHFLVGQKPGSKESHEYGIRRRIAGQPEGHVRLRGRRQIARPAPELGPRAVGALLRANPGGRALGQTQKIEVKLPGQITPQLESGRAYFLPSYYAP